MDQEARREVDWRVRLGARAIARDIEVGRRRTEAQSLSEPDHVDLFPADNSGDADSGRLGLAPSPTLLLIGRYPRRGRRYAAKTQQQVADDSGVSQSMVSRAERGHAPAMRFERLVRLCRPLGRLFPFGVCPHDHECAWQPIKAPERHTTDVASFLEYLSKAAGD